jgi:hypothetical protein
MRTRAAASACSTTQPWPPADAGGVGAAASPPAQALQVAIIDLDVHQGNGTASIFADDASVFTLSLHGQKNFPFRKEASDLDVDLPDGCGDAAYLQALEHALDELERRFEPGLVIYLAGADPHEGDRLGRLKLSWDGLEARDRRVFDWAWQRRMPLAFSMAGGYGVNIDETVQVQMNTYTLALEYWARWNPSLACARAGIRFIHTSALGLHEGAKSRFLSSKLLGERAIAASGSDYAIVRPSLLDGEGGFGARWLRGLSRSPLHCIPRGARGGIAAMTAADLGLAFAALAAFPSLAAHRELELGGTRRYGYAEYLRELRADYTGTRAMQLPLPNWMARLGAHACDLTHFSPFSYGHWILLQRDNIPSPNRLPELLGREPHAVGSKAPREPGLAALAK